MAIIKSTALLNLLIVISFTLLSSTSYSQEKNSNEIIAEGAAKTKVKPDVAAFTLTIEKNDTLESNAIKNLNIETEELIKSLNKIGFTERNIKVSDYAISSSINDEDIKRYMASNTLKVEFLIDNKLIDAFYNEIQQASINDLDVSFDTKISDSLEKVTRLRLVHLAIEDAKINANNIAKALDIKIIRVKSVQKFSEALFEHSRMEPTRFTPPKIVEDTEIRYKTSFDKFQVEEIDMEEKNPIIYEISK
jgi:uncharacterized protein